MTYTHNRSILQEIRARTPRISRARIQAELDEIADEIPNSPIDGQPSKYSFDRMGILLRRNKYVDKILRLLGGLLDKTDYIENAAASIASLASVLPEDKAKKLMKVLTVLTALRAALRMYSFVQATFFPKALTDNYSHVDDIIWSNIRAEYNFNNGYGYLDKEQVVAIPLFLKHIMATATNVQIYSIRSFTKDEDVARDMEELDDNSPFVPSHAMIFDMEYSGITIPIGLKVPAVAKGIEVYAPSGLGISSDDIIEALHTDFLSSFKGKMLTIKEHDHRCDVFSIGVSDLEAPEHCTQEMVDKLAEHVANAEKAGDRLTMLFYGPPGTGKSSVLKALVKNSNAVVIYVKDTPSPMLTDFIKRIKVFKILVLEDEDSGVEETTGIKTKHVANLLEILDSNCYDISIMTLNSTKVHPSLVRPGRADLKVKFDLPDKEERAKILDKLSPLLAYELVELADKTEGMSHAGLETLCRLSRNQGVRPTEYVDVFIKDNEDFESFEGD